MQWGMKKRNPNKILSEACFLTFTTLWANTADDELIFFLFFLENRPWHSKQTVSWESNLHEVSDPTFWKKDIQMSSAEFFTKSAKL